MDGFIPGSRATFMLDFVVVAMILIVPVMWYSIARLTRRYRYKAHSRVQKGLALALLIAVTFFEMEVRVVGWRERASLSPYKDSLLYPSLWIHIPIAVLTLALWIVTVGQAWKNFPWPPRPGQHSARHRLLGRASAVGMTATAVTGWIFYWIAFIAT